jgi:hypothetical protein
MLNATNLLFSLEDSGDKNIAEIVEVILLWYNYSIILKKNLLYLEIN